MSSFLFSYRAPADHQRSSETSARWAKWFQGLGSSVTTLGNPVAEPAEVGDCGAGMRLNGYSVIEAEDRDAALAIAKSCPAVEFGGGVEVGRIVEVPREARPA
jgi:hypothetical protein